MDGRRNFPPDPDADSRWYPDGRGYDDRGYDDRATSDRGRRRDDADRGYGDDDRAYGEADRDRGYGEADRQYGEADRGYTPTRYADEREYDDPGYRAPEPRGASGGPGGQPGSAGASRTYGADPLTYGDTPSGQFPPSALPSRAGGDSGEYSGEYASRARRSEAIDRGALQRPVSGGAAPNAAPNGLAGAQIPGLTTSGSPIQGLPTITPSSSGPLGSIPQAAPVSAMPGSGAPQGTSAFAAPTALTAAVPAPQQPQPQQYGGDPGGAVYRSKRPGLAVALVVITVLFEIPVLRLFIDAMTADQVPAGGTLAGIFMIPALPMFSLGLYGLIGGAAAAAPGIRPWLRAPLCYLPVAVLLFMAAGMAA
ncbi:hypothetical protein ACQP00_07630 [Dactylosporangium sp. CS-047395]|uniref:hypothetical protein n=1 Tax=Dactylosporangium sp. CS-047395 TaxID=3239936 RepID=UPI003D94A032